MALNRLFWFHAIVTFAAGVVLIGAPDLIPATVGIVLPPEARLIAYLLGAGEISLAALSYFGTRITDELALRLICLTFILLHGITATVEVLAYAQGISGRIWGNVALRIGVMALFWQYGLRQHTCPETPDQVN